MLTIELKSYFIILKISILLLNNGKNEQVQNRIELAGVENGEYSNDTKINNLKCWENFLQTI